MGEWAVYVWFAFIAAVIVWIATTIWATGGL